MSVGIPDGVDMRSATAEESDELPADDPRYPVAVVLRSLIQILAEVGVLDQEHLTRLALISLGKCSKAGGALEPDLAAIDFIWSVFPEETRNEA